MQVDSLKKIYKAITNSAAKHDLFL